MEIRTARRLRYPLGVVALVLGIFVFRGTLSVFVDSGIESGFPAWAPTFGTLGQTVTVYLFTQNVYAYLLVPAAAFWLGMRYERAGSE